MTGLHDYFTSQSSSTATKLRKLARRYNHYVIGEAARSRRNEDVVSAVAAVVAMDAAQTQAAVVSVGCSSGKAQVPGRPFRRIHRIGLARTGAAHNSVVTVPSSDGLATRVAPTYCDISTPLIQLLQLHLRIRRDHRFRPALNVFF